MTGEPVNTINDTSLDAGIGPADPAAVAPGRHSHSRKAGTIIRNNLILAGLFAAGLLGVYLLSLRGGPTKASAEQLQAEQQVDAALLVMSSPASSDSRSAKTIVDSFYEEAKLRQIPMGRLKVNPFLQRVRIAAATPAATTNPSEAATAAVASMDQTSSLDAVKQLKLQTILSGADGRALAMISNNLISEGQTISGWTVTKINPKDVTLTWKDQKYTMQLGD